MTTTRTLSLIAAARVGVLAMSALATQALAQENSFDKLANLPFVEAVSYTHLTLPTILRV